MAKRHHVYKGAYLHSRSCPRFNESSRSLQIALSSFNEYLRRAYAWVNESYLGIFTVLLIVVLSLLIPDISNKMHKSSELKTMKSALDLMTQQVGRAEVACLTAADEVCCLQSSVQDDETETSRELRDMSICTGLQMRDTQSEPVQIEKKVGFFRRIFFPHRNASRKEIAIMSFLYTDSFASQKTVNTENPTLEDNVPNE